MKIEHSKRRCISIKQAKKAVISLLSILLILHICSCSNSKTNRSKSDETSPSAQDKTVQKQDDDMGEPDSKKIDVTEANLQKPDSQENGEDQKNTEQQSQIAFHDNQLEQLIRQVLAKPTGEITQTDLDSIQELCIVGRKLYECTDDFWNTNLGDVNFDSDEIKGQAYKIKNWDDLKYLTNLKRLVLVSCEMNNITFIKDLKQLEVLALDDYTVEDFTPLKNLSHLSKLYLYRMYGVETLGYLRDLNLTDSDIWWDYCFYPFHLKPSDITNEVTPGNMINQSLVAYDGTRIYLPRSGTAQRTSIWLTSYNETLNLYKWMNPIITKQMEDLWNVQGSFLSETMSCMNVCDGYLYYICSGKNMDLEDEEFENSEPLNGIIKVNLQTGERELITVRSCDYMCVVNDLIYVLSTGHEFYQMSLDGKDTKLVTKEPCSYMYADEDNIYYITNEDEPKLKMAALDKKQPEVIMEGKLYNPVILKDCIFYEDNSQQLYCYDRKTKKTRCIYDHPLCCYNVDEEHVYISSEDDHVARMNYDGTDLQTIYDAMPSKINILGDNLFLNEWCNLSKIRKDGSGYNVFYEEW